MSWFYVLAGVAGIASFALVVYPLLKEKAPAIVEVPTLMQALPQIPTDITVTLPEIKLPEGFKLPEIPKLEIPPFPEFPDFAKVVEILPSTEDIKKDIIDPFLDKIPTVEDVKELVPTWVKDPMGSFVTDPLTGLGESIDKNITKPLATVSPVVTISQIPAIAKSLEQPLTGLGEAIDQNISKPIEGFFSLFRFKLPWE